VLLVHKILLNSVLLSPIVSGSVRPKPPDKHPLGHNPPCLLPLVGRLALGPHLVGQIGSGERVSVSFLQKNTRRVLSYDVLRQQKTGVMTKGGLTSLRLWHITSSPSQTLCANNGRRTLRWVLNAWRRSSLLCFSHFATRTVDNTVDLYAAKSDIRPDSRFLQYPTCIQCPVRRVPVGISPPRLVWKN